MILCLPGSPENVEGLAGPEDGVALPLAQVDLVDAAAHDDAHAALAVLVLEEVVGRPIMPRAKKEKIHEEHHFSFS